MVFHFSYFSTKIYIVGSHKKRLQRELLINTHKVFLEEIKISIFFYENNIICRDMNYTNTIKMHFKQFMYNYKTC